MSAALPDIDVVKKEKRDSTAIWYVVKILY